MSLDVYLNYPNPDVVEPMEKIFIRENGSTRQISQEEWNARFPGAEPVTVLRSHTRTFESNITHNLGTMAEEAGIYKHVWRPEELGITKAGELIEPLRKGIELMRSDPERFKRFNPENGWGNYDGFLYWLDEYLRACELYSDADVSVSR